MEPTQDAQPRGPDPDDPRVAAAIDRYWKSNLRLLVALLAIWALVGPGCGVLFADVLNGYRVGGFRLGFWFAQQGSIVVFVVLVLVYAIAMGRLDRRHHDELEKIRAEDAVRPGGGT